MAPSASAALPCDDVAAGELPHVAVFPFMARGHTIPLTHLAHLLLLRRLAAVTFFTTPGNAAFVRAALPDAADVVELPFPDGQGAETVEGVASASSFAAFAESTLALRPRFEEALAALRPPATLLVADAFLYWAGASSGVPRVSFLGTSAFSHVMREIFVRDKPGCGGPPQSDGATGTYTVPEFPHVQFLLQDIPPLPMEMMALDAKMGMAVAGSSGVIMNTFRDLESSYIDHWDRHVGPRAWHIGPLCLAREPPPTVVVDQVHHDAKQPSWLRWLDEKAAAGESVVYVALGTLFAVSDAQLKEVARGLEDAHVSFLWALRSDVHGVDLGAGFQERVHGRGMVTAGWVDQQAILQHDCVRGFLSHGGWNSVLESVCAGVPLAVWPMEFDQPLNVKLVVDELKVGVRVRTAGGLVKSEEISRAVREIMIGGTKVSAAKNAAVLAAQAWHAMSAGGSSWKMVEEMISELSVAADTNKAQVGRKNYVP